MAYDIDPIEKAYQDSIIEEGGVGTASPVRLNGATDEDTLDHIEDAYRQSLGGEPKISPPSLTNSKNLISLPNGLKIDPALNREKFGIGFGQGIKNTISSLDPAAQWIENKVGPITLGGLFPTAKDASVRNKLSRLEFDKQYGNDPAVGPGVVGGEIAASLLPFGAAMRVGRGIGALASEAVPAASPLINFLAGNAAGGKLTKYASGATAGAAQGSLGAAINSGSSDEPIANQLMKGAAFGGALGVAAPMAYDAGNGIVNFAKNVTRPFSENGRKQIANDILRYFSEGPLSLEAKEIVPGSVPTLAEASGNPGIAKLQDTLRDINSQPFVERQQQNAAARNNLLMKSAGTPQDIETTTILRDQNAQSELNGIFGKSLPVESKPIVDTIDSILNGTGGKRDAVVKTLNNIRSKLVSKVTDAVTPPPIYDASGNIMNAPSQIDRVKYEQDPETLYNSVRKQIDDLLDKGNLTDKSGTQAARELMKVKDVLDDVIEDGAPGFKNYLSKYTSASKPIEAMQWMQGLNLIDSQGNITLTKVQNALKNINKLKKAPGTNKVKSLNDDQVQSLRSIRDDLLRQQNLSIGKSYGSPTVQKGTAQNKLAEMIPGTQGVFSPNINPELVGATLGEGAGRAIGLPGVGGFVGAGAGRIIKKAYGAKGQLIRNELQDMLLNPESYRTIANRGSFPVGVNNNPFFGPNGIALPILAGERISNRLQRVNNSPQE